MSGRRAKFIAVVGPTASGKTALSIVLAKEFGGEIVCADSRTVYRGMDIGTAKPTMVERAEVPHHLLDVIDPGERLSAAAFKRLAEAKLEDIAARGHLPMLVGGSGLYADSVLFDYEFPGPAVPAERERLDAMTTLELLELLAAEDSAAYERVDQGNRRQVIRAIETAGTARVRLREVRPEVLVLGTTLNKLFVQDRVSQRIEKMLEEGFIDEIRTIGETYGWDTSALEVSGYRAFKDHVHGSKSLEQAKADCMVEHMALFKKQATWFKRNKQIRWVDDPAQASTLVREFLD